MGTYTSWSKLYKPAVDEDGWGALVNTNFDRLSENFINVKTYGAVGDGTTDDTTAIQSALTAIGSDNGGIVFFPVGRYKVTAKLSAYGGTVLMGAGGPGSNEGPSGSPGSTLIAATDGMTLLEFDNAVTNHKGARIMLMNFRDLTPTTKTAKLVRIRALNRWHVEHCSFRGAATALEIDSDLDQYGGVIAGGDASWATVYASNFYDSTYGINVLRSGGIVVVGNEFTSCTNPYRQLGGSQSRIAFNKFDGGNPCIYHSGRHAIIMGNMAESVTKMIVLAQAQSGGVPYNTSDGKGFQVIGNHCNPNTTSDTFLELDATLAEPPLMIGNYVGPTAGNWLINNSGADPHRFDGSGFYQPVDQAATAQTLNQFDGVMLMNCASAARTVTLPAVSAKQWYRGRVFTIKKTDSSANKVTIDGNGTETIDGALTVTLDTQYSWVTIVGYQSAWYIISQGGSVTKV